MKSTASPTGTIELLADGDTGTTLEIVPIAANDTTVGLSKTETLWTADVLKDSVDRGVWQGAKLVAGDAPSGVGHYELDEQLPPSSIVGAVTAERFDPARGVVLEATLLDDHLAALASHQPPLIDVSPDLLRELDDEPDASGARTVARIVDVPRITLLDRGAGANASIAPAEAEALAELPRSPNNMTEITNPHSVLTVTDLRKAQREGLSAAGYVEQHVEGVKLVDESESTSENTEQLAEEQRDEKDERALSVMTVPDIIDANRYELEYAEYLQQRRGIDVGDYGSGAEQLEALRDDVRQARRASR